MNKDKDLYTPMPDIVITEPIASLQAKIRLAAELDKLPSAAAANGELHGEAHAGNTHREEAHPVQREEEAW